MSQNDSKDPRGGQEQVPKPVLEEWIRKGVIVNTEEKPPKPHSIDRPSGGTVDTSNGGTNNPQK